MTLPRHLVTVWNPSYAQDAMDEHLAVLIDWAGRAQAGEQLPVRRFREDSSGLQAVGIGELVRGHQPGGDPEHGGTVVVTFKAPVALGPEVTLQVTPQVTPQVLSVLKAARADLPLFLRADDMAEVGLTRHQIPSLLRRGEVRRVARGLYRRTDRPVKVDGDAADGRQHGPQRDLLPPHCSSCSRDRHAEPGRGLGGHRTQGEGTEDSPVEGPVPLLDWGVSHVRGRGAHRRRGSVPGPRPRPGPSWTASGSGTRSGWTWHWRLCMTGSG